MRQWAATVAGAAWGCWMVCVVLWAGAGLASPLDLANPTPRWVEVRFEVSPKDSPGRLDQHWGPARRAYLEPAGEAQHVRIRIPAPELERQLRSAGTEPVDGSFSDFVWTLDPGSGHVVTASTSGRIREPFAVGFLRATAEVAIRVEMTTRRPAGFRPGDRILGQPTHTFCSGRDPVGDCTLVPPRRFDPGRGYVNAVGSLRAESNLAKIRAFSPLGEVLFREIELSADKSEEAMVSGTPPRDAVCSGPFSGSCGPEVRGESS